MKNYFLKLLSETTCSLIVSRDVIVHARASAAMPFLPQRVISSDMGGTPGEFGSVLTCAHYCLESACHVGQLTGHLTYSKLKAGERPPRKNRPKPRLKMGGEACEPFRFAYVDSR